MQSTTLLMILIDAISIILRMEYSYVKFVVSGKAARKQDAQSCQAVRRMESGTSWWCQVIGHKAMGRD